MNIVIDTNIFISALIKNSVTRKMLTDFKINFLIPEFELEEIRNHKQEIILKAGYSEREFDILLLRLLKYVKIAPNDIICKYSKEASEIIEKIDNKDTQFVAAALAFNCPIWSDDKHFKQQNRVKILTTKNMIYMLK